jgi:quinoprotein glucose dehydrogenase
MAQLRRDQDEGVRLASLQALQVLGVGDLREVMRVALADDASAVRRAALGILPDLPIGDAAKAEFAASVVASGSTAEQQGAIEILGTLKSAESRQLLEGYLDDLMAGKILPDLQVDLLVAAQADGAESLASKLQAYQTKQGADNLIAAFRTGAIVGGDVRRGRQVFAQNPLAECTRCHVVRGTGSDVGPDLTRIGAELSREELLEALIEPNKRIAPGFGTVGLTLRTGERVDGTLREETDSHVLLAVGDPPVERRIAKSEIAERTDPVSAMPPIGLILEPGEVRDLVEFLASLR